MAAIPPCFCASAMACIANVVLPEDSGPNISMIRPFGKPPTPSAWSRPIDPVEMTGMSSIFSSPIRIMVPFPRSFSIFCIANCNAFSLSADGCGRCGAAASAVFDAFFAFGAGASPNSSGVGSSKFNAPSSSSSVIVISFKFFSIL